MHGQILKMKTELNHPVQYYLPIGNKLLGMNQWIGKHIQLHFNGEIYCLDCGQRTKKSFNQGFFVILASKTAQCRLNVL